MGYVWISFGVVQTPDCNTAAHMKHISARKNEIKLSIETITAQVQLNYKTRHLSYFATSNFIITIITYIYEKFHWFKTSKLLKRHF